MKFWLVILTAIVFIVIIVVIQYYIKNKELKRLQARSRKLTDDAMDKSMNEIDLEWFNQNNHKNVRDIAVVSDVWGKDVMVFEYSVELTQNQKFSSEKLNALKELLEKKLFNYAKQKKIQNMANKPPFIVSDIWQLENILHIDVAYIMNEATYKYLNDIEKLEPGFKK
ncbi:hypothetical protein FYL05_02690 [Lactobacillus salivarius]|uniref:Uncharacterized protein n=2 Tax=Ligilactobacillus salivarius TaxID=1624 RepID=A0A1V9TBX4_9LACO|nr:hypothetical protein [Ligilactobacillus salivarius]PEG96615.1 hypothetical protein CP360_05605 [Lactobacillus sp. UMNPBX9]PEH10182.1 hypothetical protein CP353_04430 [Lactobacillus sp. UMNPBX2]HBU68585.1 hypothetical protein [Lactobacillus sp.]ADJ78851.1 Putative uncharacterized protein [Ligilactobacillus salivarius CECT 5713]MBM6707208.1 hypothetical protein [Ligilactobacillus salivarius]